MQMDLAYCERHYWWFGYAHYAADPAEHPMVGKLGPHFMDLSLDDFRALLAGRRGAIVVVKTGSIKNRMCLTRSIKNTYEICAHS